MKVLILGATGFIGGQIARAALDAGLEVNGVRRSLQAKGDLIGLPVEWFLGQLSSPTSLEAAMRGVDVIIHAAGYYNLKTPLGTLSEQLARARKETQTVIDVARQHNVKKLIYTSCFTTLGHPPAGENRLVDERDRYQPGTIKQSGYHEAKILMEQMILDAVQQGLPAVILTPTLVMGPGDVHLTSGGLLRRAAKGKLWGWTDGTLNIVDVRDVAQAHLTALNQGKIGERYLISGHNLSIQEALNQMARTANAPLPKMHLPYRVFNLAAALSDVLSVLPLQGNYLRTIPYLQYGYNNEKAYREFNFVPRPLEETFKDALAWYRAQGMLKK